MMTHDELSGTGTAAVTGGAVDSGSDDKSPGLAALLEYVDWNEAQHRNRLVGRCAPQPCVLGASAFTFHWDIGATTPWQPALRVRLAVGQAKVQIALDSIAPLFGGMALPLDELPGVALRTLAAQAAQEAIAAIEAASGAAVAIDEVERCDEASGAAVGLPFFLEDRATGVRVRGTLSEDATALAASLCARWPQARATIERVPLRCRFVAGHLRLTFREIQGISTGDLLLINRAAQTTEGIGIALTVAGSALTLMRGQARGDTVQIMDDTGFEEGMAETIEPPTWSDERTGDAARATGDARTHAAAGDPEQGDPAAGEPDPFDSIELPLAFELGEQTLTLGDLGSIAPGYVFRLPQTVSETSIAIRLNGRVVGNGQLVALGDALGVRVTRFLQP
jgi:type III secretion protein Q